MARLRVAAGRVAVFTRGDARQRRQLPPAERRPHEGELFTDGLEILLSVQSTFLADSVAQQQVEDRPRVVAQFATWAGRVVRSIKAICSRGRPLT